MTPYYPPVVAALQAGLRDVMSIGLRSHIIANVPVLVIKRPPSRCDGQVNKSGVLAGSASHAAASNEL